MFKCVQNALTRAALAKGNFPLFGVTLAHGASWWLWRRQGSAVCLGAFPFSKNVKMGKMEKIILHRFYRLE